MKCLSYFKPLDFPIFALALLVCFLTGFYAYGGRSDVSRIIIRGDEKSWIFSSEAEALIHVNGPIGSTAIGIREGRAMILSSPCPGQTCVSAGQLHRNGQWVACLPNRVFLFLEAAGDKDALDAVSR